MVRIKRYLVERGIGIRETISSAFRKSLLRCIGRSCMFRRVMMILTSINAHTPATEALESACRFGYPIALAPGCMR